MDLQLQEHVVLITGASGGIGRAVAEAFAAEGARPVLHGFRRFDALREWLAEQPWQERAVAVRADLTQAAEADAAFREAAERFGRVDACVANAGAWPTTDLPIDQVPEERLRGTVEANLWSAIWTARAFFGALRRSGPRADGRGATLVFTGSTAGRFGERGRVDYSLSKAALYGLVRSLKNEIVALDPYGRVNMVEPGWTATARALPELSKPETVRRIVRTMPVRQIARPADIARAMVLLCSPAASRHISGEVLTVAGGMEGRVQWEPEQIDAAAVRRRLDEE
ncbi:MAG: SDR family oxidoreductase [Deltaproteobacteria bacterium]|nr:SDR family oxidoreductase [Deltaproteobacteria bacterium]